MRTLLRDIRYALRILWRQKAFSLTVIGLLAVAIAGNTAIFSIYNGLFLRPYPFPDAERLVDLDERAPQWNLEYVGIAYADFHEWRKENRSFSAIGLFRTTDLNYSRRGEARRVDGLLVTHDFASVLQIQPVLGRGFLEEEDRPGGPKVVMLGHGFWQREFGGSPSALGEVLKLSGEVHTVVGVLPRDAVYPEECDLWVPLQESLDDGSRWYLNGTGRLKEGITLEQAREDVTRIHKNMIETREVNEITSPRLQSLREKHFGDSRQVAIVLLGAVGILLLVACVNIAGMMLARSAARGQEMGIRTALGASRAGIMRQLLTESLLLAVLGVLLGIPLGHGFLKLFIRMLPEQLPPWVILTPDIRFLAFCAVLMAAATVLFGLAPALQAARVNVQRTLHEASVRSSASSGRRRSLNALVVGEVALAVVLLVGAGLLLRAWQQVLAVDPGFRADNVLTYAIVLPESVYKDKDESARFFEQLVERHKTLPGVTAASATTHPPMMGHMGYFFDVEGAPPRAADEQDPVILTRVVLPGYIETMGIELVAGRRFTGEDGRTKGSRAAIVNQTFARRFWPEANPIGKRIRFRGDEEGGWMTVVGLNHDIKHYGLDEEMRPGVYIPYQQSRRSSMNIVIRSAVDPAGLLGSIRSQLHEMDPDVPAANPITMTEQVDRSLAMRRTYSIVLALFATVALLMAVAGVYGVVSYTVSRRTHEIGIRMALGAQKHQVLGMVLGGGMRLIIAGLLFGIAGAFAASQAMQSLLFGITSYDALTYAGVVALLIVVAAVATLHPARRAAAIEPMRALRSE